MLNSFNFGATLPAADLARAKQWYEEKLGMTPEMESDQGIRYRTGSTFFDIYPTSYAGTAQNTAGGWEVEDIEKVVAELRERGVEFEEYDFPGLKTVDGIADLGVEKTAWFKDSEGNILAIAQPSISM